MTPVNTKSLLAFVFDQMEKLDNGTISVETASTQAKLTQQSNNIIRLEHERARVKMEIERHNKELGANVELREIESKNFD